MNMYECICCLFHILLTHMFLGTKIRSTSNASSLQEFEVSITLVRAKYQPQQKRLKLFILSVNGLLCSRSSPRVREKAIMYCNGHNNLGRGKLWTSKFV